jgi:regulator of sigma E protease
MTHLIDLLRQIAAFVVTLGILVFVHEFGHYLAARWRGVYVEAFSIGFGRPIASWTDRLGTVWKLSWLPLGGYVKLHGQERPEDVTAEVRAGWKPGMTFHEKSVASRAIIVAAGPIANFALAIVLFSALFMAVGRPVALPEIGAIVPGGAAASAGLEAGDRVVQIDGRPMQRFEDIQRVVSASPGRTLSVLIDRKGAQQTLPVTIGSQPSAGGGPVGILGIRGGSMAYERVNPLVAIAAGAQQTYDVGVGTLQGVGQMLSGSRGTEELSGPLGIMKLSGDFAKLGLSVMVSFIAVLSVNLGLVNLFPIPVLDGGHLLFYVAEAVRGRPLPPRMLDYGFRAGFALLAGLFVFATWNDLTHMGLFRWVAGLIG